MVVATGKEGTSWDGSTLCVECGPAVGWGGRWGSAVRIDVGSLLDDDVLLRDGIQARVSGGVLLCGRGRVRSSSVEQRIGSRCRACGSSMAHPFPRAGRRHRARMRDRRLGLRARLPFSLVLAELWLVSSGAAVARAPRRAWTRGLHQRARGAGG